jgi:hypothetical protein
MKYPKKLVRWAGLAVIAACALSTPPVGAVPVTYTDQTVWQNAILALNPTATTKLETFNGTDTVIPPGLGSGPYSFGGGDFTITLNNVGNGGSQAGIVNNQFQMRLAVDTADIDLGGGFIIQGEGAQSIDFAFTTPGVFAFGGSWSNGTQTNGVKSDDGINISVNSTTLLLNPTGGAGFFGVVDAAGISSFRLLPDGLSTTNFFQDADLNDFRYALPGAPPATVPEPGTLLLFGIGAAGMGFAGHRRRLGS